MVTVNSMQEAAVLYRKIEARLDEKKEAYDKACEKDRRALEQLELMMLSFLNQAGVMSMNIPDVAEVKIVHKRVFGCADWDMFYPWMIQHNVPELLVKRIHEGNMQHWIDERKKETGVEELPPAVNVHTQAVIKVLKGKA